MLKYIIMRYLLLFFILIVNLSAISDEKISSKQILFFGKFHNFIKWSAEKRNSSKFVIGVLGYNPFGEKLSDYYKERLISNRSVDVIEIQTLDEIKKCHILFISQSVYALDEVLEASRGKGVLLISFQNGWAEKGVHLNYYIQNDRLKFELNPYASKRDNVIFRTSLIRAMRVVGVP